MIQNSRQLREYIRKLSSNSVAQACTLILLRYRTLQAVAYGVNEVAPKSGLL